MSNNVTPFRSYVSIVKIVKITVNPKVVLYMIKVVVQYKF